MVVNAIIFGAPGSGKGTYASRLKTKLRLEVISTGDIFREILKKETEFGKKVKQFVEKGLLVPDEIVNEILRKTLSELPSGKGIILDGYPRTIAQAEILKEIVKIEVILLQNVPDWIIIERLSSRRICKNCNEVYNIRFLKPKIEGTCDKCGGQLYQRPDDTAEVIKKRIQLYQKMTSPIIDYYKEKKIPFIISKITALDTPPEQIVEKIIEEIKKLNLA
ncbi:MAG: nucleoside monophosphate kinase [Candidatus Bathyarchaeota archaeon]|nr:nucleoside monophosphate kinase [Candidatus Bathyarchaeota archaeon]